MSLFQRLLGFHTGTTQTENFFTEIFVSVLNHNPTITRYFLNQFIKLPEKIDRIRVDPQVTFQKLRGHEQDSRPDVVITLDFEEGKDLVFIESKLGAREGPNQLIRYAEQLKNISEVRHRYLIYITQSYDPKDEVKITGNSGEHVKFIHATWSRFYSSLKDFRKDTLVDEMMLFMEENGMAENNVLLPVDVSSMTVFPRLLDFMQTSLEGEVENKYRSVLGYKPENIYGDQARYEGRVILWKELGQDWAFGVGYFFDKGGREYPSLGVLIEIDPMSSHWNKIASALKKVADNPTDRANKTVSWEILELDNPDNWTNLYFHESLLNIIAKPDHLQAIRLRLLWYLDQIAAIKKRYPFLPWKPK
jgi:hypothetical protein